MSESLKSRSMRWLYNLFPALRRTGGRITYIAHDFKQANVRIPLNWKTRNYVGTIFGGSMYAAVDPIYMVLFMKLLGKDYVVWDKSARIQFKKPGRSTLYAVCTVSDDELTFIRSELIRLEKIDRSYIVELKNKDNQVCAVIEKTLHFSKSK